MVTKQTDFIDALDTYTENHPSPGRGKKEGVMVATLLNFLADEEKALSEKSAIVNILEAIGTGTHPRSLAQLYETLDLITEKKPDGLLGFVPAVEEAMRNKGLDVEYVQDVITNLYENRDELFSQVLGDKGFQAGLERLAVQSLRTAHTSEVRAAVASQIVTQTLEIVKESFTEGLAVIQAMYSKRDSIKAKRIQIAIALLSTALSVVNASGVANLSAIGLEALTSDQGQNATQILESVSVFINGLRITVLGDQLERTRNQFDVSNANSEAAVDIVSLFAINLANTVAGKRHGTRKHVPNDAEVATLIEDLTMQAITMCTTLYNDCQDVSVSAVRDAVIHTLENDTKEAQQRFENVDVSIGRPFILEFAQTLTDEIDTQLRKKSTVYMDPTVHMISTGDDLTKQMVREGIKLYALSNIFAKGKFAGKIEGNELNTVNDWQRVRAALASGSLGTNVADSTDVIRTKLNDNFSELTNDYQYRFGYGKSLPLLIDRNWCEYLREGWVTAQGEANAFIASNNKLSPYSLNIPDWKRLLTTSIEDSLPHLIDGDFTDESAVYSVTTATLAVASPHYRHAFERSLQNYTHYTDEFNAISKLTEDKREEAMLDLKNELEASGIAVINGSVKDTLTSMGDDLNSLSETMIHAIRECTEALKNSNNQKQSKVLINMISDNLVLLNKINTVEAHMCLNESMGYVLNRIKSADTSDREVLVEDLIHLLAVCNAEGLMLDDTRSQSLRSEITPLLKNTDEKSEVLSLLQENQGAFRNPLFVPQARHRVEVASEVATKNPLHQATKEYRAEAEKLRNPNEEEDPDSAPSQSHM